ncbi:unnamed protein product [Auanema sp. JU1783]|nr:unnamed protein product [Auanema sp. JU1783]
MDSEELKELDIHFIHPPSSVHHDYRPIKIRVYKNGDARDKGKIVAVTRREFKHWIIFLDGLTKKLGTATAIHRLYTIQGIPVEHFDELEHKGEYVAVEKGNFVQCHYGQANNWSEEKKWKSLGRVNLPRPVFLESAETMDIYLKREGYGSITGLPYPFDGILTRSPSTSALHLKSHHSHLRKFGSLEKLNHVGQSVWGFEDKKYSSREKVINVPKLPPLGDINGDSNMKQEENNNENQTFDNEKAPKMDETPILPPIDSGTKITNESKQEIEDSKENKINQKKEKLPPINNQITNSRESRIPIKKITKREIKKSSARPNWSQHETYETKEFHAKEIVESIIPQHCQFSSSQNVRSIRNTQSSISMKQSRSFPRLLYDEDNMLPLMTRKEREHSERRLRYHLPPILRSEPQLDIDLEYSYDYDPDFLNY